jgi:hypothetical protein
VYVMLECLVFAVGDGQWQHVSLCQKATRRVGFDTDLVGSED